MKKWLKKALRKVKSKELRALFEVYSLALVTVGFMQLPGVQEAVRNILYYPGRLFSLNMLGLCALCVGSFLLAAKWCWMVEKIFRWAHSDDDQEIPPSDQKLLMHNALQEIEDYISGKSLADEIEKLRNRCISHLRFRLSRLTPSFRVS